jgi:adenylate kinase
MKLILHGPPACGKGSQGQKLSEYLNIPLISTGKLLRALPEDHPLYIENKNVMNSGGLSPDHLVADVLKHALETSDTSKGYILDGYGRNMVQIGMYEPPIDTAIFIYISPEETLRRITGRRMCESDGKIYNIYTLPPEELEKCKGKMTQREDDTEKAVLERLAVFNKFTVPVIEYYKSKGSFFEVNGRSITGPSF